MNLNILVVEDEAAISRVLVKILEETFTLYSIAVAYDGFTALDMLKEKEYALVLCDIKMPKMDGVEVLTKAKAFYYDFWSWRFRYCCRDYALGSI